MPGTYPTIQATIAAAATGDEVVVADGVYAGTGNKNLDFQGKAVTARSASGDPAASDLPALLKQFRTALGAGGTVKDGAIELQGDHRETIVERLRTMGYTAKGVGG